jgi:hypothetical protein
MRSSCGDPWKFSLAINLENFLVQVFVSSPVVVGGGDEGKFLLNFGDYEPDP